MTRREMLFRVLRVLILVGIYATAWLVLRGWASAQDRAPDAPAARLSPSAAAYAELLARVSYNEAGDSEADLALIHQAASGHGDTPAEWRFWLERHSPCVSGRLSLAAAYARPGRCRWTRHLRTDGRFPRGWPHSQDAWRRERARWLAHLERSRSYASLPIMCPVDPTSWDGAVYREQILARGFVILDCKGNPRNLGVTR